MVSSTGLVTACLQNNLTAMKKIWSQDESEFHSEFVEFQVN